MLKKVKIAVILVGIYLIVFWIGFRAGGMYLRMQNKVQVERIEIPVVEPPPAPASFYLVERYNRGSYSSVDVSEISETSTTIKMFKNEKLRPLLKLRDIEIYNDSGEKIY